MYLNSVLNVKALVGAFNQEKALVGAFSVIVKPMDRFTALLLRSGLRPGSRTGSRPGSRPVSLGRDYSPVTHIRLAFPGQKIGFYK